MTLKPGPIHRLFVATFGNIVKSCQSFAFQMNMGCLGLLVILALVLAMLPARAANMTPIALSGFNLDVVVESSSAGPPYTTAAELNPGEGNAFYQSGLPGKSYGLPAAGNFTSGLGDGTVFQFQPYTAHNALVMSSDTGVSSGTLRLAAPAVYNRIALIANSADATASSLGTLTLTFTDGSTFVTNYIAPDWFTATSSALQGVERIALTTGVTEGAPTFPRFYQTSLQLSSIFGASNKPLASLTFGEAARHGHGHLCRQRRIIESNSRNDHHGAA